jgi:hypothetical protein
MKVIKSVSELTAEELELGLKRLGRILTASMKVQNLSTRKVEDITRRLYKVPINKDQCLQLQKGNINPKLDTYRRLTYLLLKVDYIEISERDPIGNPVLLYKGASYKGDTTKKIMLETLTDATEFPDLECRYSDHRDLIALVTGDGLQYKKSISV